MRTPSRKIPPFFGLLLLVLILPPRVFAADAPDSLWQKAVAIAEANRDAIPGTMFSTVENLDDKGKPKETEQRWMRFSLGPDGQVTSEITKVVKDGKDVTAAEQAKQKAEQAKTKTEQGRKKDEKREKEKTDGVRVEFGSGDDVFSAATGATTSVKPLDEKKTIENKQCVGYAFTQKRKSGETLEGTAWLEESTGVPVRTQYTPKPLPKYTKRMQTTVEYKHSPEGSWHPKRYTVEGSGGFLWIKKTMRIRIEFGEWWKKPTAEGAE
jgi:hypothetical protein